MITLPLSPRSRTPLTSRFQQSTGKIEIFSRQIADFDRPDVLPPIPKYVETWEGVNSPKRNKYPLQLITIHPSFRVHSQLYSIPTIRNMEPQSIWINPHDAEVRGIQDRQNVRLFNNRGTIQIPAKITDRIIKGAVAIQQGCWYTPNPDGIDLGACANVLTRSEHSPGGAFCSNTVLVQIEKI